MTASIARMAESPDPQGRDDTKPGGMLEPLPLAMTAAILCGGQSRRMGRAKAFLPYAGTTMLEHRFDSLRDMFSQVVLVANDPDAYCHITDDVVKDIIPNRGPLVGILSALLVSSYEHTFVIACDMPLVTTKLIRHMVRQRHGTDVLVAAHEDGIEPLLGVYSRRCVQPLEECIFDGNLKVMDFLKGIEAKLFQIKDADGGVLPPYFNVNTPQDYSRLITNSCL
jgi:molybdopterin-guanine dinucleotide biosynthesis protein A